MSKKRKRRTYRRRPRRRRSYYMGVGKGLPMKQIQSMLVDTAIGTVGAIGGTMVVARIPVKDPRIKAFMPLVGGMALGLLARGKQADIMRKLGSGLMIAGGLAVVKQFAPQFALAGENEMYEEIEIEDEDTSLLGVPTDLMGVPSDLMGQYNEDEFELDEVY